jgi:integrase/recombinase XerD
MKLSAAIDLYIAKRQPMGEKFYSPAAVLRALSRSHGEIELSSPPSLATSIPLPPLCT